MKRILTLSATALVLAVSLSGCGEEDVDQDPASAQSSQQPGSGRPGGGQPGSGQVAAVDGSTAQVQGSSSQTAVTWTSSTTFTQQVAGSLDDVTAGSCVVVSGEGDDTVTATSVRITEAEGDDCSGGFGGPGGDRPDRGDAPQDRPSDAPTDRPSDAPRGMGGGMGGGLAAGRVTAATDSGFTVASTRPGSDESSSVTVAVTDDTTYTTTEKADADDVKVGVCVQTRGESDSKGAVTATSIAISPAADGECVSRGPGGRGGAPEDEDQQDEAAAA